MFIKQLISKIVSSPNLPENATLIDVRSEAECANGVIDESLTIPVAKINAEQQDLQNLDKSKPIIVYCAAGGRAVSVKKQLQSMGFTNVVNGGGINNVSKKLEKPIVTP